MSKRPLERCCLCDEPTGRAGKGEDSLYTVSGDTGPFCENCFDSLKCGDCDGDGEVFERRNERGELDYIDGKSTGKSVTCESCKGEGLRL